MSASARPPSVQWELLAVPELPGCQVWAWFFPTNATQTVAVTVPSATQTQFGPYLTARRLIAATGIPLTSFGTWQACGVTLNTDGGANAVLDQPFPSTPGGADLSVTLTLVAAETAASQRDEQHLPELSSAEAPSETPPSSEARPASPAPGAMALEDVSDILAAAESVDAPAVANPISQAAIPHAAAGGAPIGPQSGLVSPSVMPNPQVPYGYSYPAGIPAGQPLESVPHGQALQSHPTDAPMPTADSPGDPAADRFFAAIDADWKAIEQIERQLLSVTKQLNGQASKLQSLNRDLGPNERLVADSNDVKEWNTVRRMLRDAAAAISKQVRAFDIGTVSAAGNRNRFQEIYESYVKPRKPFDDMARVAHEFEQHRKICQSLLTQSGAALSGAQRDAEGKARTVLNSIRAKARRKK